MENGFVAAHQGRCTSFSATVYQYQSERIIIYKVLAVTALYSSVWFHTDLQWMQATTSKEHLAQLNTNTKELQESR